MNTMSDKMSLEELKLKLEKLGNKRDVRGVNALDELNRVRKGRMMAWAEVMVGDMDWGKVNKTITLPLNYTQGQLEAFYEAMDFRYDNGFGSMEMGGTIMFTDGSWIERREYDGSEWWQECRVPQVPEACKR